MKVAPALPLMSSPLETGWEQCYSNMMCDGNRNMMYAIYMIGLCMMLNYDLFW